MEKGTRKGSDKNVDVTGKEACTVRTRCGTKAKFPEKCSVDNPSRREEGAPGRKGGPKEPSGHTACLGDQGFGHPHNPVSPRSQVTESPDLGQVAIGTKDSSMVTCVEQ